MAPLARSLDFWGCCVTAEPEETDLQPSRDLHDEAEGHKAPFSEHRRDSGFGHAGEWEPVSPEDGARAEEVVTIVPSPLERTLESGEFVIDVSKDKDGVGLEIESVGGSLLVAKLKNGPIRAWNAAHQHQPEVSVRAGDRIVKVNGVDGDSSKLIEELKRGSQMRMVLRHPRAFQVSIEKGGKDLGICVVGGNVKLDMLKISALKDGVIEDWNKSHPTLDIDIGDRITAVNDIVSDPQKMLQELKSKNKLDLTVIRPS